jgi:hypothetical protein
VVVYVFGCCVWPGRALMGTDGFNWVSVKRSWGFVCV